MGLPLPNHINDIYYALAQPIRTLFRSIRLPFVYPPSTFHAARHRVSLTSGPQKQISSFHSSTTPAMSESIKDIKLRRSIKLPLGMAKDSPEGKAELERLVRQNRRNFLAQLFVMVLMVFAIVTYTSGSNERGKGGADTPPDSL
jgi:hypothetical protein